ncbi:methyltransferase domain-containing protein, partial [Acinetobacter baumannii]|nr:methyltransferase domain-containing protein [Acinetobacter baumannii]
KAKMVLDIGCGEGYYTSAMQQVVEQCIGVDIAKNAVQRAAKLNDNLDADLYGYRWARDNVGQSGATIYRLYGKPNAPELFLKHGKVSVDKDVTDEMVRLKWLTAFMP